MSAASVSVWRNGTRASRRGCPTTLILLIFSVLTGCGTLPRREATDTVNGSAIPISAASTLGRMAIDALPAPELSGFRLMPLGTFSLDARLQLARRAEVSLDVQYYHLANDETGRLLLRALRDAANRGVRVRLFMDDLYTSGEDWLLLGLAAHPNIEVRLFNPFCCARDQSQALRFAAATGDWSRINHRMHNKLFVADGAMAVIGGRNIANEYYLRSNGENFVDVDAFTVGFIVPPLQALFDRYWNSAAAWPLEAVAKTTQTPAQLRARFEEATDLTHTPAPEKLISNDVLGYGPIADDLEAGRLGLIWGSAYVFADHPDKPFEGVSGGDLLETSVTFNVYEAIGMAQKEVIASSPYFVPGASGMTLLRALRKRNVNVTVMTNSLAATDEFIVHAGYSRYREEMLRIGVDLYELTGTRLMANRHPFLFGKSLSRLHAKLVVIDRKVSFIGSMNLDPRSATVNTEIGAIIDSPELARELIHIIDIDRLQSAYRVRLSPLDGQLEWLGMDDETEIIMHNEPDSSQWLRLKAWLLGPLIPDELL